MPVAVDSTGSAAAASAGSLTWSHTVGGADRFLGVAVGGWDGSIQSTAVFTATFNGSSLTRVGVTDLSNGNDRVFLFRLANPAAVTSTITCTMSSGSMHLIGGSVSFTGAHQTDFAVSTQAVSGANSTTATLDVPSATDNMVFNAVISGNDLTHLPGGAASHTERWDRTLSAQGEAGAGGTADGAATVTVSWGLSVSASWAQIGVEVKALAAGAATTLRRWHMTLHGVN